MSHLAEPGDIDSVASAHPHDGYDPATVADDIREELAKTIARAIEATFGYIEPPADVSPTDRAVADAILASPVITEIRAEAWDEGLAVGWERSPLSPMLGNPYRLAEPNVVRPDGSES